MRSGFDKNFLTPVFRFLYFIVVCVGLWWLWFYVSHPLNELLDSLRIAELKKLILILVYLLAVAVVVSILVSFRSMQRYRITAHRLTEIDSVLQLLVNSTNSTNGEPGVSKSSVHTIDFLIQRLQNEFRDFIEHFQKYRYNGCSSLLIRYLSNFDIDEAELSVWEHRWWRHLQILSFYILYLLGDDVSRDISASIFKLTSKIVPDYIINTRELFVIKHERNYLILIGFYYEGDEAGFAGLSPKLVKAIRDSVAEAEACSVSIGYCTDSVTIHELNKSVAVCRNTAFLRYMKGKGAVSADAELQELSVLEYPYQPMRETIECLFENEVADCRASITHLLSALSSCDYMQFVYYSTLCLFQLKEEVDRRTVSAVSLPVLIDEVLSGRQELSYVHQLEHLLLESAYSIKHWQQESAGIEDNDIIQAAKKYILDNYHEAALCAASVAEALKQSEITLKRKFRRISGQALHTYINRVRLEKMAEALRCTTEPIKQLTERIGFANYAYFFTLFKKYYGVTPQQYRDRAAMEELK